MIRRRLTDLLIALVLALPTLLWLLYGWFFILPAGHWRWAIFLGVTLLLVPAGRVVSRKMKRHGKEHSLLAVQAATVLVGYCLLAGGMHAWAAWQEHAFWDILRDSGEVVVVFTGDLKVADPETRTVRTIELGAFGYATEASVAAGGHRIAVVGKLPAGEEQLTIVRASESGTIKEVVFSMDARSRATRGDAQPSRGTDYRSEYVGELSWDGSSRYLAFATKDIPDDSVLRIWDDEGGELKAWPGIHPATGPDASPPSWHPDRATVVYEDADQRISTLDVETGEIREVCSGRNPHWLSDDVIVFRTEGTYRTYRIGAGPGETLMDAPSHSLGGRFSPTDEILCFLEYAPQEFWNVGVVGIRDSSGRTGSLELSGFLKSAQVLRQPTGGFPFAATSPNEE